MRFLRAAGRSLLSLGAGCTLVWFAAAIVVVATGQADKPMGRWAIPLITAPLAAGLGAAILLLEWAIRTRHQHTDVLPRFWAWLRGQRALTWSTRDEDAPRLRPCMVDKAGELCLRRLDDDPVAPVRCFELLRSDPSVALDDGTPQGWVCNAGHRWTCVMTRRPDA